MASKNGAGEPMAPPPAASTLEPLKKTQNRCLRRVTGGYRRTPTATLERETEIPPVDIYANVQVLQHAQRIRNASVEQAINKAADQVWASLRPGQAGQRPHTSREKAATEAQAKIQEMQERQDHLRNRRNERRQRQRQRHQTNDQTTPKKTLQQWGHLQWKGRWEKAALEGGSATVWSTPWKQSPRKLYAGLTKAESTALFLLRTEVLGLNAWLAAIHKPGIYPQCPCGWMAQTVRHILLHCPRYDRTQLLINCSTERKQEILNRPVSAAHAAQWFIASGVLGQFKVAKEVAEEDQESYRKFDNLEDANS